MPRIHVAGDVTRNTNLIRLPPDATQASPELPATVVRRALGGAALLSRVIEVACSDLDATVTCGSCMSGEGVAPLPETLTIWAQFPRGATDAARVWRVEQFMRTHRLDDQPGEGVVPMADRLPDAPADILVLDDESMGFRDDPERWRALLDIGPPAEVVLKTRHPLPPGELWRGMLALRDRLTVVVPVSALRARHAPITRGLSWDRTMEDVHRELTQGASSQDLGLARRVVIPFGYDGVAVFARRDGGALELERFIYHPERLEGGTPRAFGRMLGGMSILTAAIVRHLASPDDYPLFIAAARGLAALADNYDHGGGPATAEPPDEVLVPFSADAGAQGRLRAVLHHDGGADAPEADFRSAFHLSDQAYASAVDGFSCSLLQEVTGPGQGHVLAAAIQVVTIGLSRSLESAPRARYADFLTVDREEIERTNEIHRLFRAYRESTDRIPLSIAVFGPPGSGKSFAIRQLARHIFGEERETLEWNLSQMTGRDDLLGAFDQIRDASVRGRIPMVFWDEFDTGDLVWLKEFLAPMQDAQYCAGSVTHPFGKVIFVFAGGTASTFQRFDRSRADDVAFRARKGPDFISRLRGYVNIKGPNRSATGQGDGDGEEAGHLIRRAYLIRSVIARTCPHLIDPVTGVAAISPSVIRGFLFADTFHHGARSIEQLVKMSDLAGTSYFGVAQLPTPAMLRLHVSDDFLRRVEDGEAEEAAVELLARAPTWGELFDIAPDDLAGARHGARMMIEELLDAGWRVVRRGASPARQGLEAIDPRDQERLLRSTHEHWLREHLLLGYDVGPEVRPDLRLHPAIRPWTDLPAEHRDRLRAGVAAVLGMLAGSGFGMERIDAD